MRKAQKKQAEDFLELLGQAHEEIKKAVGKNNIQTALSLLADCQDGAISLGELIEKTEGEGVATIPLLEEYCEQLFKIHTDLNNAGKADAKKVYKILRQSLVKIENSVKNDIKVRVEVVFLPYKASMWDSLESVWKAADEDPDCDAYVIPIPYYDKNPDGSFGEMHYEADQYPAYVPVMQYGEYDFEKRRPDIIFIHNPYDECNYVTSVLPFFYSKNLKQFTEQLVYIPYFILGEIKPDDKTALEGMKKFCLVPGVMNADKVIVQSEDMRQVYIEVLVKVSGEKTRGYWEKKVQGLGSPKVDKVLGTKKEDLEIPDEWMKVIRKPDGSWKKIVFYNTSVSALLEYNEKMLEKIRDVIRVFYENRDEVALLWRPHPLIEATISSMRSQLWKEYREIEEQYKNEAWGIFDDSSDIDRAVILSDAYYGDRSSVVQLYEETGKPVLLQNMYLKNSLSYSIAATEVIIYINKEYWYVPYWNNALYRMNSDTYETEKVGVFDEKGGVGLFSGVVLHKKKLFFAPRLAEAISVYDMQEERMYQLQFQDDKKYTDLSGSKFYTYVQIDSYLYLIPYNYRFIVMVNMETDMIEKYPVYEGEDSKLICGGNAATVGSDIYFVYKAEACVLKFNTKMKTIDKIFPGNEKLIYSNLFCINGKLWLIPADVGFGIRVWDVSTNEFSDILAFPDEVTEKPKESEIEKFPENIATSLRSGDDAYFKTGMLYGEEIHLLAQTLGKNIVIHTTKRKISSWDAKTECFEAAMYTWTRSLRFISYFQKDKELYAVSGLSGEWYYYRDGMWEKVKKRASIIKDGKKELVLDGEEVWDNRAKKVQNMSKMGEEIYWNLMKKQIK